MAVTFTYAGWSDMTNIQISKIASVQEPGGTTAQRSATLSTIEGTGIVVMTADTNTTTGIRRRIDDIRRILTTPGGRLVIAMDGVVVVDHSSEDYNPGGTTTTDFGYGPVISCDITEISGAKCAFVQWKAEYRLWSNVADLNPITGFVCTIRHNVDRNGYTTINRSGVLTVRRSAGFPARESLGANGSPVTVIAFIPSTAPFGGGQTPAASGVPTTLGNNPDLYRRFVAGPLFGGFVRESQDFHVDESMQRLVFSVTDRQTQTPYPNIVTEAEVSFAYEMNLEAGPSALSKSFSAELYGNRNASKSDLLAIAVQMSQNRILWNSGSGVSADMIVRMAIREPDMLNRNGIIFEVNAIGTNLGFAFTPPNGASLFSSITDGVATGGPTAAPDAYGTLGLATLTDFVYEAAPAGGTHVSPNTSGGSLLGQVPASAVVAQIVPIHTIEAMIAGFGANPIPDGDAAAEASEAPQGYIRVESTIQLEVSNRITVANSSVADAGDRIYQFGKPKAIAYERIEATRKAAKPDANVLFASLPWAFVELAKRSSATAPKADANGNIYYSGLYERWVQILSPSMTAQTVPPLGSIVTFAPLAITTPQTPQLKLMGGAGVSAIPASKFIQATEQSGID